jgi:signal transduction histidine kinase
VELSGTLPAVADGPARALTVLGWVLCAATAAMTGLAVAFAVAFGVPSPADLGLDAVLGLGNGLLGAFVLSRRPRHPIGWLFAVSGFLRAVGAAGQAWSERALGTAPGPLPGGPVASWLGWSFLLTVGFAPMIVVLFPDGRLPGPRWRVVPAISIGAFGLGLLVLAIMWPYRGPQLLVEAPTPAAPLAHVAEVLITVVLLVAGVGVLLGLAGVLVRARRAGGDLRQQVKWFGYGAACALLLDVVGSAPGLEWVRAVGPVPLLVGVGLGIFRYRLYDVDRLINRTLVYGLLTVALTAVFAAVDITVGAIVGAGSSVVAAAGAFVAALLLRPVRDRLQDLIDRVFDRSTHDAVRALRALAHRVGHEHLPPGAVLDALRTALRDPDLRIQLHARGPDLLVDPDGTPADPAPPTAGRAVERIARGPDTIALVMHSGREPGRVRRVLAAATPVLEYARLQAELSGQLAEVRESRARLVAAGDAERRRVERDLHDGAQQRLVGLALHLQAARRRERHLVEVDRLLEFTVTELQAGLDDIRSLVHGLLPPALTAGGLPAAVGELVRPGAVTAHCAVPARLDPGIEATAWFVACEGITNATRHAGTPVRVDVRTGDGCLRVLVADDGPGGADPTGPGLRHLADRVAAHAGTLRVDSPVGGGTRLTAVLPCG